MKSKTTNLNVANYRSVIRAAAILILTMICGGLCAQTVSISPTTGNVISALSYGSEQHEAGYGGAWVHNQLPMTLLNSDESTLTDNGLMAKHANNVGVVDGYMVFASGAKSTTINHMSLSLPKGYRFTSYKIVMDYASNSATQSTFKEMNSLFSSTLASVSVKQNDKGVVIQRTSLNASDMGNILYFKQEHLENALARVKITSFVVTFECTEKFDENLKPGVTTLTSGVSCLALPFQTQRVDLGPITQKTVNSYTSYKYDYNNVKDLAADFLLYDNSGIVGGTAKPGTAGDGNIAKLSFDGTNTYIGLKNNTYWLETPTDAVAQGDVNIPVGYRIVGARLVYVNNISENIKKGDKIYITDGKGKYMNASLKFTATKVEWNYAADGKLSTTSGNSTVYLRHEESGFLLWKTYSLKTTNKSDQASAFNTDGTSLFYGSGTDSHIISFDSNGNAVYDITQQNAIALNANVPVSDNSFTVKVYDKTGENVAHQVAVNRENPTGDIVLEKINNDAIKFQIEGLTGDQLAYVCLQVQLEALNPYIDKMDISCTQPSGEKKLKNQYLADDFTIGTNGKVDFAVPTNFGTTGLRFAFEGLHHKSADETYGDPTVVGKHSRYHFVKSEYYNLIDENLQDHRSEAADYDYTKKIEVKVAGTQAFKCNNSDIFKAGKTGDGTHYYVENRYSNAAYNTQGGTWNEMVVNNGDGYVKRYLVVCDETRYNIAPTTTPRHAFYAYYSTDLKLTTVDYVPELTYTKVYKDAVVPNTYDANYYVGVKVSLKDTDNQPIAAGQGYVYAKQIIDKIDEDITNKKENAPVDTKHILYFDASNINSLLFSDMDPTWGTLTDLKAKLGDNALLYMPEGVTANLKNVVTKSLSGDDFVSENDIELVDQQPFFAPYSIRLNAANEVVYKRKVTLNHNETKKWVSLMLPFTVAVDTKTGSYVQTKDNCAFTFYTMNTDNTFSNAQETGEYIYEADAHFSPFTGVPVTKPNQSYIVSIDQMEETNSDKVLFVVRQSGSTIEATPATLTQPLIQGETATGKIKGEATTLVNYGSYCGVKVPKTDGIFYFNKDKFISSLLLDERFQDVYVLPFRSYYACQNGANNVRYLNISLEPNTETSWIDNATETTAASAGFMFSAETGKLTITATKDLRTNIRNINGQTIDTTSLKAGETRTVALPSGIYMVNGTKVVVR